MAKTVAIVISLSMVVIGVGLSCNSYGAVSAQGGTYFIFTGLIGVGLYLLFGAITSSRSDDSEVPAPPGDSQVGDSQITSASAPGVRGLGSTHSIGFDHRPVQTVRKEPATKQCPMCAEAILVEAIRCRFCGHQYSDADLSAENERQAATAAEAERVRSEAAKAEHLRIEAISRAQRVREAEAAEIRRIEGHRVELRANRQTSDRMVGGFGCIGALLMVFSLAILLAVATQVGTNRVFERIVIMLLFLVAAATCFFIMWQQSKQSQALETKINDLGAKIRAQPAHADGGMHGSGQTKSPTGFDWSNAVAVLDDQIKCPYCGHWSPKSRESCRNCRVPLPT